VGFDRHGRHQRLGRATHTQALNLTGTLLGSAPAGQQLVVSAALPLRNTSQIAPTIESGAILTPSQVAATFGPTASQVQAVEAYFAANGFTSVSADSSGLLVTGNATVAQAEQAFDTSISNYNLNGKTVYANTAAASVPAYLASDVTAVLGLSDIPMGMPNLTQDSTPDLNGFGPKAVANAYGDSSMKAATGTTTAIIASGDMTGIIANLRFAEKQFGYSQVPVQVIYDGPQAGIVNNNPLTSNLEWDLDTQISTMVPKAVKQLDVYDVATFTDPEVARGINMFVAQDKATALSASLGECDYIAFLDGAMLATDNELAEGALQGQSMFASTGDNGYACPEGASTGVPEGPPATAGRPTARTRPRSEARRCLPTATATSRTRSPGSAAAAGSPRGRPRSPGRCRRTPRARSGNSPTRADGASPTCPRWPTATRLTSSTATTRPAPLRTPSAGRASRARWSWGSGRASRPPTATKQGSRSTTSTTSTTRSTRRPSSTG
jgi:hypothetical protein